MQLNEKKNYDKIRRMKHRAIFNYTSIHYYYSSTEQKYVKMSIKSEFAACESKVLMKHEKNLFTVTIYTYSIAPNKQNIST